MPTTFHGFAGLPPELRNIIWKLAATNMNRIVEVHWQSEEGFSFHTYPPSLLSTSSEAREATIASYHKSRINRPDPFRGGQVLSAYFNFENDILYFPYETPCEVSCARSLGHFLRKCKDAKLLKHLAFALPPPNLHSTITLKRTLDDDLPIQPLGRPGLRDSFRCQDPTSINCKSLAAGAAYFIRVQELVRGAKELNLETIILVNGDPIVRADYPIPGDLGVVKQLLNCQEGCNQACATRWKTRCQNALAEQHSAWDPPAAHHWLQQAPPAPPQRTWGKPTIQIREAIRSYEPGRRIDKVSGRI